jgi:nitrous oxide reductase accessory protein NosL
VTVTYLTDYSAVDYRVQSSPPVVSAQLDTAAFTEEDVLKIVVESSLEGAMGPALVPFSESSDAVLVTDEYGGEVINASEVTETMVAER